MQVENVLDDICMLSATKATTALSKFLQAPIGVKINEVKMEKFGKVNSFRSSDEQVTSLYFPITGNINGMALFLYSEPDALAMCNKLLKRPSHAGQKFNELEVSALSEIANILVGNFLTSLAHSLELDLIIHHVAIFEFGPWGRIIQNIQQSADKNSGEPVTMINFKFQLEMSKGDVIFILDQNEITNPLLR